MSEATCKTCPWIGMTQGVCDGPDGALVYDFPCCRLAPPPWDHKAVQPESDWCGEHPNRKET